MVIIFQNNMFMANIIYLIFGVLVIRVSRRNIAGKSGINEVKEKFS